MSVSLFNGYSPGRVELLGNHTDYNQGRVLAGAIDRGLAVSGHANPECRIRLRSIALKRSVDVAVNAIVPQAAEPWADYALGVVKEFLSAGVEISGFDATVSGDLPAGGGLSSSAAFELATAHFLLRLHGSTMEPMALAKLCQRAENGFTGVRSGLLDQATCTFGREEHAVMLDCRSEEVTLIPFPPAWTLLVADSGVKHSLVQGEYNKRREQCQAAAAALGVEALRDATLAMLFASDLPDVLHRRATHIVGENERVLVALDCLKRADGEAFGALMSASHESSRVNFENSSTELDLLVSLAQALPGVAGARLTGGGFGGSTITLVRTEGAEKVRRELNRRFAEETGRDARVFPVRLADGAR